MYPKLTKLVAVTIFEAPLQISGNSDIWLREIENEMHRIIYAQLFRNRAAILK